MNILQSLSFAQILLLVVVAAVVLSRLYRRVRYRREIRVVGAVGALIAWRERLDTPEGKLEMAQRSARDLRRGFFVNIHSSKIYFDGSSMGRLTQQWISKINVALELGFSYEEIGTTREEVIGFRNGGVQRVVAGIYLDSFRSPNSDELDFYFYHARFHRDKILKTVESGGFSLEDISTSLEELEALCVEYGRQFYVGCVRDFIEAVSSQAEDLRNPYEFEELFLEVFLDESLPPKYSYEEMETSREEFEIIMASAQGQWDKSHEKSPESLLNPISR